MPALLIAYKKDSKGNIIEKTTTPFNDFGNESVSADKERVRLEEQGYTVKVLRMKEQKEMEARGQSVWIPD